MMNDEQRAMHHCLSKDTLIDMVSDLGCKIDRLTQENERLKENIKHEIDVDQARIEVELENAELRQRITDISADWINTQQENARLRTAIINCLNNNGHLADGDNCTLIDLKRAVPEWRSEDE